MSSQFACATNTKSSLRTNCFTTLISHPKSKAKLKSNALLYLRIHFHKL
ncbi:hypothetical protein [Helicobacter cinaedi]|nr:hypothetical protein [Helicobacter cinaedi]